MKKYLVLVLTVVLLWNISAVNADTCTSDIEVELIGVVGKANANDYLEDATCAINQKAEYQKYIALFSTYINKLSDEELVQLYEKFKHIDLDSWKIGKYKEVFDYLKAWITTAIHDRDCIIKYH